jgi:hypothetical protein
MYLIQFLSYFSVSIFQGLYVLNNYVLQLSLPLCLNAYGMFIQMLLTSSSLILYLFDSCKIYFSCFSLAEVLKGCHLHLLRCNSFGLEKIGSQMDQKKRT